MSYPTASEIEDLTDSAVVRKLTSLIRGLSQNADHFRDVETEYLRTLLTNIIEALDEADEMDSFGTEGWREFLS